MRQQLGGASCPRFVEEQTSGGPAGTLKLVAVHETEGHAVATVQTTAESGTPIRLRVTFALQDGHWLVTGF